MWLFQELQRRNVFRVAAAYLAIAWLIAQIAETVLPVFGFNDAVIRGVMVVLAIGFVPVLVAAWALELTPGGLRRDRDVSSAMPASARSTRHLDRFIMVALALAVAYFAIDKYRIPSTLDLDKSIAVLPFVDMSPGADHAYFTDGISEEILNYLARLNGLRVISRSSAFAMRDKGLSVPEIAEKLNVSYVLEGSLRPSGDKVRITAQLIEARSDSHMWSGTFDHTLDDIFLVQEKVSLQIAKELKIRLPPESPPGDIDAKAYEYYLNGLSELARRSPESVPIAIDLFEQVIAIEPAFAPAHARLAIALIWMGGDLGERAEAAANHALVLDPENSEALSVLGLFWQAGATIDKSREMLKRAIASNPNNELAYRWLGTSYSNSDPHRYLEYVRKAYRVNPLDRSILYHFAKALSRLGRFDEAIDAARERVELNPENTSAYSLLATMHWRNGDFDEALKVGYHTYRIDPSDGFYGHVVYLLIELGITDLAEAWIAEINRRKGGVNLHFELPLYARRGEHDKVIQLLEKAVERGGMETLDLAHGKFRNSDNFEDIRQTYESGFNENQGTSEPLFNPETWWPWFIDYAFVLQKTGEASRALEMIDQAFEYVDAQLSSGVVGAPFSGFPLEIYRAQLHNIRGNKQAALESLRRAGGEGGLTCVYCLRNLHHYENLQSVPAFEAIVADAEAFLAAQRENLTDEGWLLTPDEVMQREENAFNPFTD